MEEEGVRIVETSGHKAPDDLVGRIHAAGMVLIHKCVAPRYARKAESVGADAVTVVGWENGGAVGTLDIATLVLVPRVVDAVTLPVIAGGGVGDGRGLAAVLALGAEAAILGTLFMAAEEAPIHPNVRRKMIELQEHETMLILRSLGNTHRVAQSENARKVHAMEARGAGLDELLTVIAGKHSQKLFAEGDLDSGLLWIGQAVGFIQEIKPAAEIVAQVVGEAEAALARMERLFGRAKG
jgi:nitronate monooxygenase